MGTSQLLLLQPWACLRRERPGVWAGRSADASHEEGPNAPPVLKSCAWDWPAIRSFRPPAARPRKRDLALAGGLPPPKQKRPELAPRRSPRSCCPAGAPAACQAGRGSALVGHEPISACRPPVCCGRRLKPLRLRQSRVALLELPGRSSEPDGLSAGLLMLRSARSLSSPLRRP